LAISALGQGPEQFHPAPDGVQVNETWAGPDGCGDPAGAGDDPSQVIVALALSGCVPVVGIFHVVLT
jgi:hypothetical protein